MKKEIILIILLTGVIYKLVFTWDGNFLFLMDSARDMVDVREMVIFGKPRLVGPNTAIEGFFNGPFWYYLLAIPFITSSGNPYASIVMQIIMWAVGGIFLLKIISKWSTVLMFPIGFLWIASDYISLSTAYVFNPNPVTLLTPLFIFLVYKYMETNRLIFAISTFFLGGLFFNFEMTFGIFIPVIIFCSILLSKKTSLFKSVSVWVGLFFYFLALCPQIIFDLKHKFIISNAIMGHLDREIKPFNFLNRFHDIRLGFYNVFKPTIINRELLSNLILIFSLPVLFKFFKDAKKDTIAIISICYIFIPFIGFLVLPVTVNPWHLGGPMAASIVVIGFLLKKLWDLNLMGKFISLSLSISILYFSFFNILKFFIHDRNISNMDPSLFKNEIAAIDFVYKYADGKNFKVYTYLPSVYDYPYQYLIWWHGLKEYGFLPIDYAYAPNKPQYIPSKEHFSETSDSSKKRPNSNLVFLIKEPDRNHTRSGWEGEFINLETIKKQMVGPIEVEVRREVMKQ